MIQPKNRTNEDPNDSLQHYFDELLLDGTSESLIEESTEVAAEKNIQSTTLIKSQPVNNTVERPHFADANMEQQEKLKKLLQSAQATLQVTPATVTVQEITAPEIQEWDVEAKIAVAEPVVELQDQALVQSYQMPGLEWLDNGLPQWAQARFDVLLVKVSGLTLAVPLISLGQIQPITDELTPIFGQADWFIGIQPTNLGKIRLVNTAKFVMPERYDESFVKNAKLMISINGVPWGLAVDSVNQPISLEPEAIKWRTDRSKRPWLAGTIKDHMCALLDIPRIGQLLMESDKKLMKNQL